MTLVTPISFLPWNSTNNPKFWKKVRVDNSSEQTTNSTSADTDCIVLDLQEFIPWNNPDNIVSADVEKFTRLVQETVVLPVLFLFGFPANIINMAVFYKQGLDERINVCLFALSLADGLYLASNMVCYGEQLQIQFTTGERFGPIYRFTVNNNLLGFFAFTWISQILSAIIAIDRCFCILQPLRSQNILRASTMASIIVVIYLLFVGLFSFSVIRYRLGCALDPFSGDITTTFVAGEFYLKHQTLLDFVDYVIFGTGLPGSVIIVIIITTIITAVKLRQAAAWRAGTSSGVGVSQRDIALTKMLVSNSAFFIACVLPFALVKILFLFMPEVNAGRRQHNFYIMVQSLMVMGSYVNSSFNILVYYTMGSRYRQTFWQIFGCRNFTTTDRTKETTKEKIKFF